MGKTIKDLKIKNTRLEEDAQQLRSKLQAQESGVAAASSRNAEEVNRVMQDLVGSKMELAELKEQCVVLRNDLHKSREMNMKMAAKMTKLETMVYAHQGPSTARAPG